MGPKDESEAQNSGLSVSERLKVPSSVHHTRKCIHIAHLTFKPHVCLGVRFINSTGSCPAVTYWSLSMPAYSLPRHVHHDGDRAAMRTHVCL